MQKEKKKSESKYMVNAITGFEKRGAHKTAEVVCNNTEEEGVLLPQEGLYSSY